MQIKFKANSMQTPTPTIPKLFAIDEVSKAQAFHASFPEYQPTPLAKLQHLAQQLNIGGIYVKDESYRFGLNAFKVLGGSFAIGQYIAERIGKDISQLSYQDIISEQIRRQVGDVTFATTTDGNHGRGVAWTANRLQQKSVVYMPVGSQQIRLENIRALGATASITDNNYDDTVRMTAEKANKHGWVIVQDTAWPGYTDIPNWIMQGYATMGLEALEQLANQKIRPTHVFLQAGVGSMAAAIQGLLANIFSPCPKVIVVETAQADCFYQSAVKNDGKSYAVGGDLQTIMAGLACGEVNPVAWEILRDNAAMFVSCPDWVAANGMRILGNPLAGDDRVVSGESGAVTLGLLHSILNEPECHHIKEELQLDTDSQVLLFSTEGDTDPDMYRRIVWNGEYSKQSV